jgi:two-component system, NarL family, response regulator YdfI
MLSDRQDESTALSIFEAAGLSDIQSWLGEIDLLVLTGDVWETPDLEQILLPHKDRLAVLLLVDDPQNARSLSGLALRAWGVLSIDCSIAELNAAVYAVNEGLLVYSPLFSKVLYPQTLATLDPAHEEAPTEPLTQRETEVLQLLAQGLANKQIAARLAISEHTVKFHVSSIYSKLNSANRTEAVRAGVRRGLITL